MFSGIGLGEYFAPAAQSGVGEYFANNGASGVGEYFSGASGLGGRSITGNYFTDSSDRLAPFLIGLTGAVLGYGAARVWKAKSPAAWALGGALGIGAVAAAVDWTI